MILKKGTVSQEVARWQQFLGLPQDGIFDDALEAATRKYQSDNKDKGLEVDGMVGPETAKVAMLEGYDPISSVFHDFDKFYYPPKPTFRSPDSEERIRLFGKFEFKRKSSTDITILGNWAQENIVEVVIPQLVGVAGAPKNGKILFHKKGVAQLKGFFQEVENQGLLDLVISWAGSFYPRFVRGSQKTLSNHSWGTAFDINAPENWLGQKPAAIGKPGSLLKLVPIANSFGFYWGGHYNSRLDGMHFELAVLNKFPANFTGSGELSNEAAVEAGGVEEPAGLSVGDTPPDIKIVKEDERIKRPNGNGQDNNQETLEKKVVNAPPKDNSVDTSTKLTIAGVAVPPLVIGAIDAVKSAVRDGYVDARQIGDGILTFVVSNWKYVFMLIGLIIVLITVKKAFKQITLLLKMWIAADPKKHDVEIQPQ